MIRWFLQDETLPLHCGRVESNKTPYLGMSGVIHLIVQTMFTLTKQPNPFRMLPDMNLHEKNFDGALNALHRTALLRDFKALYPARNVK